MAIEPATEKSMQDNASDLEALLYPEEIQEDEPATTDDDEVSEDEITLPEDDDSDSDDEEGSEDEVDDVDDDGELTLAGLLGIDDERIVEAEDGQFVVNAIVDGETKQVPLKDLVADYQLKSHVNNKSIALENERKEFEEVKTKVATEMKARVEGITSLSKYMEEQIIGEFNSINWNELRQEDPAQWAALRQDYAEKAQQIQKVQNLAAEEQLRMDEEQQQQMTQQYSDYLKEQTRQLVAKNPDWVDESKREKDLEELSKFVGGTYGFTAEEMRMVSDHRLVEILKDARAFRQGKESAETKRLGKKLPKFQKPGGNRGNAASLAKARKVKELKAKRKKSGHVNDVAASIIDRM